MCDCISASGVFRTRRLLLSSLIQDKEIMCPEQKNKTWGINEVFIQLFFLLFFLLSLNLKNYSLFILKKKSLLSGSAAIDKHFTVNHDKSTTTSLSGVLWSTLKKRPETFTHFARHGMLLSLTGLRGLQNMSLLQYWNCLTWLCVEVTDPSISKSPKPLIVTELGHLPFLLPSHTQSLLVFKF